MPGVDFDGIENNKFWKSVITLIISGVVGVISLLVVSDILETRYMLASGYEYRRIVAQRTVLYTYQWVKIGSPESREISDTSPEKPE